MEYELQIFLAQDMAVVLPSMVFFFFLFFVLMKVSITSRIAFIYRTFLFIFFHRGAMFYIRINYHGNLPDATVRHLYRLPCNYSYLIWVSKHFVSCKALNVSFILWLHLSFLTLRESFFLLKMVVHTVFLMH